MDVRLALMTGTDIPVEECQLVLHQPSIEEIGMIGEEDFNIGVQCLWIDKKKYIKDENLLSDTTNFQIFMTIMRESTEIDKKKAVEKVLYLLFPKVSSIMFTPRSMLFKLNEENIIIDESNFGFLQNVLKKVFCYRELNKDDFNPANEEARKIAEKLMRGRQRVAAQKAPDNEGSAFGRYLSILAVGLQISITDLKRYTMYQIYDLIERYRLYIDFDLDIRSRLAGGKPDSHPDDWMKNIH